MPRSKRTKTTSKKTRDEVRTLVPTRVDDKGRHQQRSIRLNNIFDRYRRDMQDVMNPWSSMMDWRFPREFGMLRPYRREEDEGILSRTPLVDMVDKGDRYHLRLEIPGIDKDKLQLNATEVSIEISGEQSEEHGEDKGRNYIYNERSYNSFYRSIPTPEEIIPSKISAKMQNGILQVDIPKKEPSRPAAGSTRIQIE